MKRRGFSLTELLVAVALVGLSVGVVIVRLGDLTPGWHRDEAASLVLGAIELCRRQAVATRDFWTVSFDFPGNRVTVRSSDARDASAVRGFALPESVRLTEVRLGGRPVTEGSAAVVMTPTGVAPPFVVVISSAGHRLEIASTGTEEEVHHEMP